tara:strand:+ start:4498 stop:4971 length:474 start_codon:yes stop_codon:yes gene_type:complete
MTGRPPPKARNNASDNAAGGDGKKVVGRPFKPGNPGRPNGSRHKTTLAIQALLDGEGEALTRKAVELALAGDVTALRLCLERITPARKDAPVLFELRPMDGAASAATAMGAILSSVASGGLTPGEASGLAGLVEAYRKALETTELETRLKALEERQA